MRVKATPEELLRRRRVRQRKHYWRKTHQRLPPSQVAPPFGFRSVTENYWWKGEFSLLEEDFDVDPATLFCNGCIDLHPDAWNDSRPQLNGRPKRLLRGEQEDNIPLLEMKHWPKLRQQARRERKEVQAREDEQKKQGERAVWTAGMLRYWTSTDSPTRGMKPEWWDKTLPGIEPTGGWLPGIPPKAEYHVYQEPRYVQRGHYINGRPGDATGWWKPKPRTNPNWKRWQLGKTVYVGPAPPSPEWEPKKPEWWDAVMPGTDWPG